MLVIPAIDLMDGACVRLYRGDYDQKTTYAEEPYLQARRFEAEGCRRLHIVDLDGAREGSGQNRRAIRRILESVSVPVQVGGGIRETADVEELLGYGVGFLILGTIALEDPETVTRWVENWGPDRFIVSLDLSRQRLKSRGWTENSSCSLEQMVERIHGWHIHQVICTDVDKDGTLDQPGYETHSQLRQLLSPSVLLIAAGGVSRPGQLEALESLGVRGAIVGRALYEGAFKLADFMHAG